MIGLVIYGDLNIVTGGFIYDRRVVEFLRDRGDSVEVFSLPWQTYGRCLFHNFSRDFLRTLTAAPLDVLLQDELNIPLWSGSTKGFGSRRGSRSSR